MNGEVDDRHRQRNEDQRRKTRRLRLIVIICAAVLAVDILVIVWAVPWVDENYSGAYGSATLQGSLGFVITFLTIFANFLILIGLLAYYHNQQSYPSDRWQ